MSIVLVSEAASGIGNAVAIELSGRNINNGALASHAPQPNSVVHSAARHGITGLTKALTLDGRAYGIACSQIDIGNAATERTGKVVSPFLTTMPTATPLFGRG